MAHKPFVSVVVPTYNRKEMLRECLESLFIQNYPKNKYEIIVVNDGSTDGTEEILKEYERKAPCKFKWFTQKNKGPASGRNLGIKNATGEIVCFVDDDCIADKNWIKNLIMEFVDERVGGVGGEIVAYKPRNIVEKYYTGFDQKARAKEYLLTGNAAYRKDILKLVGGFDENLRGLEDVDLGIRIRAKGYLLKYAPNAIVYHRHYDSLIRLMRRHYCLGKIFCKFSKKYVYHFSLKYYLVKWTITMIYRLTRYPLAILRANNKKRYAIAEFLGILSQFSAIIGLIRGAITEDYRGRKIYDRLDFLESESIINLFQKIIRSKF